MKRIGFELVIGYLCSLLSFFATLWIHQLVATPLGDFGLIGGGDMEGRILAIFIGIPLGSSVGILASEIYLGHAEKSGSILNKMAISLLFGSGIAGSITFMLPFSVARKIYYFIPVLFVFSSLVGYHLFNRKE